MPDREKVIRGLAVCTDHTPGDDCQKCPYHGEEYCTDAVMRDALDLLRENEPVEPIKEPLAGSDYAIWQCGECRAWLRISDRFCGRCGKKVKRDADGA